MLGTPTSANQNLLACYTSTQTAAPCNDVTSPLLGVYLVTFAQCPGTNCGSGGSSAVITPPGRAVVASNASASWSAGQEICRDPSNPSEAIASSSGACPLGQAVGVAVGDAGSSTSHTVDLNFSDQGVGSSGYWSPGAVLGAAVSAYSANTLYVYGFYMSSQTMSGHIVLDLHIDDASNLYSVGIYNSTGTLVAHIGPRSFSSTSISSNVVAFTEGTVLLNPGKYYFGFTGNASTLSFNALASILIPLGVTSSGTTSGGALPSSFTPPADAWAAGGTTASAFALAP